MANFPAKFTIDNEEKIRGFEKTAIFAAGHLKRPAILATLSVYYIYHFLDCFHVHYYRMKKESYEDLVKTLIKSAKLVDHSLDPCDDNAFPTYPDSPVSK